ncbi:prolyl oligopeptidase family serine peptidase [Microbispora sp. NPDC049125]|uniref:S9 family peptidase n=1 Tax=Microbispora sp. NPDC049125 TaxID=3154929 RepID=UPI0034665C09
MTEILGVRPRIAADTSPCAWTCKTPALAPDARAVAYISDRDGSPRVWIQPLAGDPSGGLAGDGEAWPVDTGPEPAADVSWSPTGGRLAVLVIPGGGEHAQIWTVRPDGGDLRPLAAPEGGSASFARWTGRGETLLVGEVSATGGSEAVLVDAVSGRREVVAAGPLLVPAAISRDHRRLLVRCGPRGARQMYVVSPGGGMRPLLEGLPGSTDHGTLSPDGTTAYLLTDAGRDRAALLAVREDGEPVVLAERRDAELDQFAMSADGRRIVLVWNDGGRSTLESLDTETGAVRPLPAPPAEVVTSVRVSRDGSLAVVAAEGPARPSHVVLCDLTTGGHREVAGAARLPAVAEPELLTFRARDGLELSGWLYRAPGVEGPAPFAIHLHGGPEAQARPEFTPLFQSLPAAGIGVFAPNVRGSSGFGRRFRGADDLALRFHAIDDVADCAAELVRLGLADPGRIACMGRSYGGYLTLAALVTHPRIFRAGVDVCGMADFATFYARTEPWIAAAAVSEYGHPVADRELLRALSPLHSFDRLTAPLLVVHGARDTNVPAYEAEQVIQAARARGVPCDQLLFEDEGHEIRRTANRVTYVEAVVDWLGRHLLAPA